MLCQACHRFSNETLLCEACRRRMRPAPDRILPGGLMVVAAFEHQGPARKLVHDLKYRGLTPYAQVVASIVAPRLPPLPLVPVPRALSRHIHYGIDPAALLADAIASRLQTKVVHLLSRPIHSPRRAGGDHRRALRPFRLRRRPTGPVILVDDVVTTGATLISAVETLGSSSVAGAVAANTVSHASGHDD